MESDSGANPCTTRAYDNVYLSSVSTLNGGFMNTETLCEIAENRKK